MSRSLTRAVVLNKKKLDYAPRSPLSWSPLESSVSSVKYFDETSASSAGGEDEVARRCQGAEIVIIKEMPFGAGVISALPRSVSMIIEAGTGYNNIDCSAARSRGISVCNVPDYSSDAVATMVMTAVLNFSSGMFQLQRSLSGPGREEGIEKFREEGGYQWPLFELLGKRIGLVGGSGTIGRKVTSMALPFGMNVAVTSRTGTARSGQTCVPLDEMLATSDFVSLHCPLNDETEGMMGMAQFKKMKKGSYLINTARGGVVNQPELVDFLNGGGGGVEGAFLDVQGEFLFVIIYHSCTGHFFFQFSFFFFLPREKGPRRSRKFLSGCFPPQGPPEPPDPTDPVWDCSKIFMSPHLGWQRTESRQRLVEIIANNVRNFKEGRVEDANVVN